ncbi:LOW QUALITY PROTEIN: hypothetical protein PHMEG_00033476 [Phytophthora megakarya]|uniref:Peptidase A2 domain-containing protein n=1 Tax=Phytophthora megakarya TaxID=4795 RepID=A0A225UTQ6_9STRA|nr:LOW QUALITY PROTEIN: hypothetical protein PHMEG_00033476 [Phytophthora megakarya]
MIDGMPMNRDIQMKKEKNTKTLLMKTTLWQLPMKWNVETKRTGRTQDRTLESRRPNSREVLIETIGSSGKITLIGSRDNSTDPAERAAICHIQLTFVEDDASFASKSTSPPSKKLAKLVRTKVDKKDIAPELQTLLFGSPSTLTGLFQNGLPQLAEPAIEAECVYAFVGECEWSVKSENCVISTENGLERSNMLDEEGIMGSPEDSLGVKTEGIVSSVVQETPRRRLNKEVRLLPGERMGWWLDQKFVRRVRMWTLVEGAVNDKRTRILLDTGANGWMFS